MPKISVITPTRDRIREMYRLLDSIVETSVDYNNIELLFAVDDDDTVTVDQIYDFMDEYKQLNINFHIVERSTHFVRDYYNFLSKKASGRWIIIINDDVKFMTKGWDQKIINNMELKAKEVGDDMLYGIVHDGLPRSGNPEEEKEAAKNNKALWHKEINFSCWVLTSKEFVNFFGGVMDDRNRLWGADHWTGIMWQNVLNGSRVVMIRDVLIDHISHHVKDMPQPPSFKYFQKIMADNPMVYTERMAKRIAKNVERYIHEKNISK